MRRRQIRDRPKLFAPVRGCPNCYLLNLNRYVFLPEINISLHKEYAKLYKLEPEKCQAEENLKYYLETIA